MKKTTIWMLAAMLAGSITMTACEKLGNPVEDAEETAQSAEDFGEDSEVLNALVELVQDVVQNDPNASLKNGSSLLPNGATISYVDDDKDPAGGMTIEINMSTVDENEVYKDITATYEDIKARAYKGTMYIHINKPFKETGCKISVSYSRINSLGEIIPSSKVGYIKYQTKRVWIKQKDDGTPILTLTRLDAETWKIGGGIRLETLDRKIEPNTKHSSNISPDLTIKQVNGLNTQDYKDDAFEVSGIFENSNRVGKKYTIKILENLYKVSDETCSKIFTAGKVKLKNNGSKIDVTVDFGKKEDCDNKFTILLPGNQKKEITL